MMRLSVHLVIIVVIFGRLVFELGLVPGPGSAN